MDERKFNQTDTCVVSSSPAVDATRKACCSKLSRLILRGAVPIALRDQIITCFHSRLYTLQQYCKLAEDFQRKLFFASGSYPALMIEVRLHCNAMMECVATHCCSQAVGGSSTRFRFQRDMQCEYWRQRNITSDLTVEYGNDVEGTAFCSPGEGDPLGDTDWNLQARLPPAACLETYPIFN